jgi:hypothetical protein
MEASCKTIVGMTILVSTNQTLLVIDQRHTMEGRAKYMMVQLSWHYEMVGIFNTLCHLHLNKKNSIMEVIRKTNHNCKSMGARR